MSRSRREIEQADKTKHVVWTWRDEGGGEKDGAQQSKDTVDTRTTRRDGDKDGKRGENDKNHFFGAADVG